MFPIYLQWKIDSLIIYKWLLDVRRQIVLLKSDDVWIQGDTLKSLNSIIFLEFSELSGNFIHIDKIPRELYQCTNLKILTLNYAHIKVIPPEISQLSNLQILDFDNNQITQIPPELGSLTNLRKLSLRWNLIKIVPEELCALSNLIYLDLKGNPLMDIPQGLIKFIDQNTIERYYLNKKQKIQQIITFVFIILIALLIYIYLLIRFIQEN